MVKKETLNGSTDLLAQAMREVFGEAKSSVRNGMHADMKEEISMWGN